jgi:hypothetical protein
VLKRVHELVLNKINPKYQIYGTSLFTSCYMLADMDKLKEAHLQISSTCRIYSLLPLYFHFCFYFLINASVNIYHSIKCLKTCATSQKTEGIKNLTSDCWERHEKLTSERMNTDMGKFKKELHRIAAGTV